MSFFSAISRVKFFSKSELLIQNPVENKKFGTFLGVFVPCILMLFGVIIFLRLGWIVGQVGISTALAIITCAASIALITCLSMAAISTNIEVGRGGVYYMLSRSLGIEAGSAVGIPLFLRQGLTIAFCCIGFAESLHDLIPYWDIRTISIWTLSLLTILACTSVRGALKVQVGIFIAILASLISLFTGSSIPPESILQTTTPSYLGFWAIFALFFPAMTGVESSVSLSGDLRNPSRSLPIGTITAILTAYAIYVSIALFLSYHVPMDRLITDPLIMQDLASVPSLIIVGIWGATLSSALGGLLGAPRTLQAIADDGIVPKFFGKTYGPMEEPRIATLVTFLVALFGTYFGSVNMIAPLLTMISLICYGVLNLSAGIESLMANPSWRPRFRVHWSISFFGAALCLVTMLMIDSGAALLSIFVILIIYFLVRRRQFQTSWVDIRQGILLYLSRFVIYQLAGKDNLSKSWRPHFLVFTKYSEKHSTSLLKFSQAITQSKGFLTMASFVKKETRTLETLKNLSEKMALSLREKKIDALVQIKEAETITTGMHQMINHYGLGPLTPNTILFGGIQKEDESIDFVKVLQTALSQQFNVVIMSDNNHISDTSKTITKDIHVWWDDEYQANSELMLVLSYMLHRNPTWKNKRICVKSFVLNELQKNEKLLFFQNISIEKRLPIDVEIFVAPYQPQERMKLIKDFSKNAEIVFLSLAPPSLENPIEAYVDYLQNLSQEAQNMPPLALVTSAELTPLRTILE